MVSENYTCNNVFECLAGHFLYPDGILGVIILVSSVTLLNRLHSKAAEDLEGDDYGFTKAIVALAFVNLLFQAPYLVIDLIIGYVDKAWKVYGLSDAINTNLKYASIITPKAKDFSMCITFWVLIFARQFRSAFCKN